MTATPNDRKGDKIFIDGGYQFNAYYFGNTPQRFWHYAKLEEAQKQIAPTKGDRILDAGCGSGLLAWFLAKDQPAEIWATDGNPAAINFCKTKFPLDNLHFSEALIDELPFPDQSFDKIVFLEVIEHISPEQADIVLQKFYALLAPGGILVISTPNKRSLWPLIEFLLDTFRLVPTLSKQQHEYLYNGGQLTKKAEKAGFECISQKTINFLAPWMAAISWKMALKIHALEVNSRTRLGSLLLYSFSKPRHKSPTVPPSPL